MKLLCTHPIYHKSIDANAHSLRARKFSQCTYSMASPLYYPCCSLVVGKMSRSLPLITSTKLMSHTKNIPHSFSIHFHSLLHPSPPPTFLPLFIPYEHNLQFHLKWQLSHLRKILESFFSRNSMVIHHVNGRTVYQLSETTLPAQCFEYALPTVSDC